MKKTRFIGVILAAEYSPQSDYFKPLFMLNGKAAVRRLTDSLHAAGISEVLVVTGHDSDRLAPFIRDAEPIYNPDYKKGMTSSIKAGLSAALKCESWDGVFLTPVDYALIRPYVLKLLMREFQPGMESVLFPSFKGRRGHPMLISRGMAEKLCAFDAEAGHGVSLFSQSDAIRDVEVGSGDILANMDTPEACENMKQLCSRKAPTALECEYMLMSERIPERIAEHCRAAAEKALVLADDAICAGYRIDKSVAFAAAMLHDICYADTDRVNNSAKVASDNGFPLVAMAISGHAAISDRKADKINEAAILYMADKMA